MPADPVVEQIARNVFETLKGVTVDGGYTVDLSPERRRRRGHNPKDGLCVIYQGAPTLDLETTGPPAGTIFRRVPFVLQIYLVRTAQADDPIDRLLNLVSADVETALMTEPHRGGWAHDTILGDSEFFDEGENGYSGVLVSFECQYGHLFTQPDQTV